MSVSSSHVMSGDCAWRTDRTITHDMDGLCPWRHSARLLDPRPDHRLGHLPKLEVADDAVAIDEERAWQRQHPVAACGRAIAVEDGLKTIEPEGVEERSGLVARLHEIDLEHDDIRLAGGDALQRGHLLAARQAPGGPKVHDHDLAAVGGEPKGLAIEVRPLEVRRGRADPPGGALALDLGPDDARVGHARGLAQQRPEERSEGGERDRADDDRGDPPRKRGRLAVGFWSGRHAHPTSGRKLKSCGSRANCPDTRISPMTITSVPPARFTTRTCAASHRATCCAPPSPPASSRNGTPSPSV